MFESHIAQMAEIICMEYGLSDESRNAIEDTIFELRDAGLSFNNIERIIENLID